MTGTSDGKMVERNVKSEEPKPTFSITEDMLPEIKKWKVGKKYNLGMVVEMVGASKGEEYSLSPDKKHRARFKILEAQECDDDENYKTKTN